jgi:hypothetical protein
VHLEHLPPNCTGFLQPLDVGLNAPVKRALTRLWTEWAVERYRESMENNRPLALIKPGRVEAAVWMDQAWNGVKAQSVVNAFTKCGMPVYATGVTGVLADYEAVDENITNARNIDSDADDAFEDEDEVHAGEGDTAGNEEGFGGAQNRGTAEMSDEDYFDFDQCTQYE